MIGLGTQDSLEKAHQFVDAYRTTFPMLWDDGFDSWTRLGVVAQPAAILFSADGKELGRWSGAFDEAAVLRLIGA